MATRSTFENMDAGLAHEWCQTSCVGRGNENSKTDLDGEHDATRTLASLRRLAEVRRLTLTTGAPGAPGHAVTGLLHVDLTRTTLLATELLARRLGLVAVARLGVTLHWGLARNLATKLLAVTLTLDARRLLGHCWCVVVRDYIKNFWTFVSFWETD